MMKKVIPIILFTVSAIFLHVAEKKNCTRFLTCHSIRQIM